MKKMFKEDLAEIRAEMENECPGCNTDWVKWWLIGWYIHHPVIVYKRLRIRR